MQYLKYKEFKGIYYVSDEQVKSEDGYLVPPRRFKKDYKLYFQVSKMTKGKRIYKKQTITYPHDMKLKSAFDDARDKKKILLSSIDCLITFSNVGEESKSLSIVFDKFMNNKRNSLKPRSLEFYTSTYNKHIRNTIGNKKIKDINKHDIENIMHRMRENGYAERTVFGIKQTLQQVFNKCFVDGVISINPLLQIQNRKLDNEVEVNLSKEEIRNLMHLLHNYPIEPFRGVFVFLSTGRRLNEVLTLKWEHIDSESKEFRIDKANSKNSKTNIYPLNDLLINALPKEKKHGYIFTAIRDNKKHLSKATLTKHWKKVTSRAKLDNLRMHDLRHIIGNTLVSNGATLEEVGALLGHSSIAITRRYAKAETQSKATTLNKFMGLVG